LITLDDQGSQSNMSTLPEGDITLDNLWLVDDSHHPLTTKFFQLEGATIIPGTLRTIMRQMPDLWKLDLRNPWLSSPSILSDLKTPHSQLSVFSIQFTEPIISGPDIVDRMTEELAQVVDARKFHTWLKPWEIITLKTNTQSIELVQRGQGQ
jgi:hypothetical protein